MDSKFGAFAFLGAVLLIVGAILFSAQLTVAVPPSAELVGDSGDTIGSACALGIVVDSTRTSSFGGNLGGGCKCNSDSDCRSGRCDCRTTGSQERCCNNDEDASCKSDSECQSYNCVNGKCAERANGWNDRPKSFPCDVNEDCHSGTCNHDSVTGHNTCA